MLLAFVYLIFLQVNSSKKFFMILKPNFVYFVILYDSLNVLCMTAVLRCLEMLHTYMVSFHIDV